MTNQRRPGGPPRGKVPLPKKKAPPKGSFLKGQKLIHSAEAKTTTIRSKQNHSLTYRKVPITLWKPNLPNYDDEDHD